MLPEEYDLNVEEGDVLEAAAVVDVPMAHTEAAGPAAELSPPEPQVEELEEEEVVEEEDPTEAWVKFVEEKFGQKVQLPTARARRGTAAGETQDAAVPAWRRFMMGDSGEPQ